MNQNLNTLDAQSRTRALEHASFIVEAPAGAGKTELLTQRYLKLLQTVSAPEEIVAITFTNKAAAEMRARILESLLKAAKLEKPSEAHKQITYDLSLAALRHAKALQWQLIENPSCLRIFTIDSLCAYLARQMPLMSRFGTQPRVTEDAQMRYAEAADNTLVLLEDVTHGEVVKSALRYVDNNAEQLKNLLIQMLAKRDQWLHHAQHEVDIKQLQATLSHLVTQAITQVAQAINSRIQFELMPLARFAATNLPSDHPMALLKDWHTPLTLTHEALPMWQSLAQLLLTDKGEPRKAGGINIKLGFPATDEARVHKNTLAQLMDSIPDIAILHSVRYLPMPCHHHANWVMIAALSKLLNLAVAQLWLVFQQAGEVDFVEIASRATQALASHFGEPTELALKLDYQIQHLLVDEFQDTSPSQVELLKQLTLGWQAGDGRTLFCVGDPMQSIYRFRKANVGLFIEAAMHGIGGIKLEKLQLYRNNRSQSAVVSWINQTFVDIFPKQDDVTQSAIHYRPFMATKLDASDTGVEIHAVIKQVDESYDDASQREAEAIIRIIQQMQGADTHQKTAVLVRSKKHLMHLVSQLRRLHPNIKFQAVEIEALAGRQVVQDLLSLTHALHHRADRVHWLAVLRAPWCGLTLRDLHALAGHDSQSTVWSLMHNAARIESLSADGQARLLHVRNIFSEAFATQGRMNVSRWVRGVWLMLNGTACLWTQADVVDVQAFFACMNQLDHSHQFSPERMDAEITKLFASPDAQGECLQMMTIHKSKGLEFDTVILPGLGASTGGNHQDYPLLLWEEVTVNDQTQLLAAPYIPKSLRDKETISPYDYLKRLEKARDQHEAARVLYVAATRAERKLHLLGIANQNKAGEIKPTANTYLDLLWTVVAPAFKPIEHPANVASVQMPSIENFTPHLVRLESLAIPAVFVFTKSTQEYQAKAKIENQQTLQLEADIGTLTHRYLELIAKQGLENWPIVQLSSVQLTAQHWLLQQGHSLTVAINAAQTVQSLLAITLSSLDGQWVLQSRADAQTELAITTVQNNVPKNYVIDRTFIENGRRWIIDYKTTALASNVQKAALKILAEQYRTQLENYAQLFNSEPLPVMKAVFFVSVGQLVLLE